MSDVISRLEMLLDPNEHHDGAVMMRCALVSLIYNRGFSLNGLYRFDRGNFGLFVALLDYERQHGQTADLRRLAEMSKDYLVRNKEDPTVQKCNVPGFFPKMLQD